MSAPTKFDFGGVVGFDVAVTFSIVSTAVTAVPVVVNGVTYYAVDISGRTYTAKAYDQDGTVAATFTCTAAVGTDGRLTVSLANGSTTTLGKGRWGYVLKQSVAGVLSPIFAGVFTLAQPWEIAA